MLVSDTSYAMQEIKHRYAQGHTHTHAGRSISISFSNTQDVLHECEERTFDTRWTSTINDVVCIYFISHFVYPSQSICVDKLMWLLSQYRSDFISQVVGETREREKVSDERDEVIVRED